MGSTHDRSLRQYSGTILDCTGWTYSVQDELFPSTLGERGYKQRVHVTDPDLPRSQSDPAVLCDGHQTTAGSRR